MLTVFLSTALVVIEYPGKSSVTADSVVIPPIAALDGISNLITSLAK